MSNVVGPDRRDTVKMSNAAIRKALERMARDTDPAPAPVYIEAELPMPPRDKAPDVESAKPVIVNLGADGDA